MLSTTPQGQYVLFSKNISIKESVTSCNVANPHYALYGTIFEAMLIYISSILGILQQRRKLRPPLRAVKCHERSVHKLATFFKIFLFFRCLLGTKKQLIYDHFWAPPPPLVQQTAWGVFSRAEPMGGCCLPFETWEWWTIWGWSHTELVGLMSQDC